MRALALTRSLSDGVLRPREKFEDGTLERNQGRGAVYCVSSCGLGSMSMWFPTEFKGGDMKDGEGVEGRLV
jgi:hypothetical protein